MRFVVVGANAAGLSAASVAKRRDPSMDVIVLDEGERISYSACGIPYWVAGEVAGGADALVSVTLDQARTERGLDVRTRWRATRVDARARALHARDADGRAHELAFDELCLATGSEPILPFAVPPGIGGVFVVRHLADGDAMRAWIERAAPRRAAIVGGGFVGLEMAEALVARGIETTLVLRRRHVLGEAFDEEMTEPALRLVEQRGVRVVVTLPKRLLGDERPTGVATQAGVVPTDMVVLATGVRPRSELARDAGCALGPGGAVLVDDGMRASAPHVWAAGDCATAWHRALRAPVFAPLALAANRGGRVVGENVSGGDAKFPGVLGTVITRCFDLDLARTGLTEAQARAARLDVVAQTVEDNVVAGYMPGAGSATIKLVLERKTARILGAQIVGARGAGKRIDIIATAMHAGLDAGAVAELDLAYAPPYSPVYDPVLIAARLAERKARR